MENLFIEFLPPWIETNLQPAFYDAESGSVLQLTALIYGKVNELTASVNQQNTTIAEYISKFNDLHDYVYDYFDNLDVQEEINNKLDDMVDNGTMQELVDNYINIHGVLSFDTLADMKASDDVVEGSTCRILGRMALNDGGDNTYKARLKTVSDVVDNVKIVQLHDPTLVADLIIKDQYLNFTPIFTRYMINDTKKVGTDVWYCIIPSDYKPELFLANDTINSIEYGNSLAYRNKTSLLINAGLFNTSTEVTTGLVINNGETLKGNDDLSASHNIIYMLEDGTLNSVAGTTPTEDVEALEPEWAVTAWSPIVKDGVDLSSGLSSIDYKPRSFIGQDASGNYIIGAVTGRKYNQQGMTQPNIKDFVESVGFTPYFLFNLDGGGSSEMICDGRRVSRQDYFNSRKCANYIGWRRKDGADDSLFKSNYNTDVLENNFEYEREPKNQLPRLTVHDDSTGKVTIKGSANSDLHITGQIACLNIQFTTSETLPAYRKMITGLPLPYQSSNLSVIAMNLDDNTMYKLTIQPSTVTDSAGVADLCVGRYGGGLPSGTWFVQIAYPMKDGENRYNF